MGKVHDPDELAYTHLVKGVSKTRLTEKYDALNYHNVEERLEKHGIPVLSKEEAKRRRELFREGKAREQIRETMSPEDIRDVFCGSPAERELRIVKIFGPSEADKSGLSG